MKLLFALGLLLIFTSTPLAFSIQSDENSLTWPNEIAAASQTQIQDTQGNELAYVLVDQQVLIVADVTNALDKQQPFTYIVQIQDNDGVVVSLGWLSGSLAPNQILSPALSWIPQYPGMYNAAVFVWEGIDNPSALSYSLSLDIEVRYAET